MAELYQDKLVIKKSDNRLYYHNRIEIPKDTDRVIVRYNYYPVKIPDREWENEIDLVLIDADGDIGTRGHAVKEVEISEYYAPTGYEPRKPQGTWDVVFGAGRMISDEVTVEFELEFIGKERRFYAGDTHCHTNNSDGSFTYEEIADKAVKKGLEFLIMTDHNRTVIGNLPMRKGLTMIYGVELTYPTGHSNLWGVHKPYSGSFVAETLDEWKQKRDEARRNGALVSINHPLCTKCPWKWTLKGLDEDCVEVWNGVMRPDNQRCIEWWHSRLAEGEKLPMVGGSDYHRDYVVTDFLGNPVTYVLAESRSPEDILKAIKEGRTSVSDKIGDTFIDMTCGDARLGDTVPFTGSEKVKVSVKKLRRNHTLYIKDAEGVMYEYTAKKTGDFEIEVPVRAKGFVRAEVKTKYKGLKLLALNLGLLLMMRDQAFKPMPDFTYALTAPIYFE